MSVRIKAYYKFTWNICNVYNGFWKQALFFLMPNFIRSINWCMFTITFKLVQKAIGDINCPRVAHLNLLITEPTLIETYFPTHCICIKWSLPSEMQYLLFHRLFIYLNILLGSMILNDNLTRKLISKKYIETMAKRLTDLLLSWEEVVGKKIYLNAQKLF